MGDVMQWQYISKTNQEGATLNELGAKGWELVSTIQFKEGLLSVLKRPVLDTASPGKSVEPIPAPTAYVGSGQPPVHCKACGKPFVYGNTLWWEDDGLLVHGECRKGANYVR